MGKGFLVVPISLLVSVYFQINPILKKMWHKRLRKEMEGSLSNQQCLESGMTKRRS